ncbi:MAG: Na/Pi cotransporter family protein [Anaerostipes sp.]|nr:Na/Pi cotransporter family protein [Anaerostipes sp.]
MNSSMEVIFGLLGGLAIFIFGMNMMSECLQKAAGSKMKSILSMLTRNPVLGVLAGALTTAVLQSSSATTVMVIGFVSAGLMTLPQAISIILGANIGTTMTAQIIAFKISDYIYIIVFIGFIISFVSKNERVKNIGQTIFAFGLLFTGIEIMGDVMKPLASSPVFINLISRVSHIPILGVGVGTLMTLVVQSSSATIAVLQNFAAQSGVDGVTSIIGLTGAIPILLGDNIGTTITALLACVGQSRDAKRTAVAHCIFNISGCLVFIWLIKPFAAFVQMISPKGPEIQVIARQIANAHTTFNIVMTLVWTPLIWLMVKIVMKLIPNKEEEQVDATQVLYLDDNILNQPTAALELVIKEVMHCSDMIQCMLGKIQNAAEKNDTKLTKEIIEKSGAVSNIYGQITEYLANLFAAGGLTEKQSTQTAAMMYVLSDIDRMGNLCSEMAVSIQEKIDHKYDYSPEAMEDLIKCTNLIRKMYRESIKMLTTGNVENADGIIKEKEEVLDLDLKMRKRHMSRVKRGKCSADLTAPFSKILHSLDRMGNSCINIVEAAVAHLDFNYFISTPETEAVEAEEGNE